jgi:hypothetical protein
VGGAGGGRKESVGELVPQQFVEEHVGVRGCLVLGHVAGDVAVDEGEEQFAAELYGADEQVADGAVAAGGAAKVQPDKGAVGHRGLKAFEELRLEGMLRHVSSIRPEMGDGMKAQVRGRDRDGEWVRGGDVFNALKKALERRRGRRLPVRLVGCHYRTRRYRDRYRHRNRKRRGAGGLIPIPMGWGLRGQRAAMSSSPWVIALSHGCRTRSDAFGVRASRRDGSG